MRRRWLAAGALGIGAIVASAARALPVLGPTGDYYEFVATAREWSDALADAASRSYLGHPGYVVTITSSAENQFVENLVPDDVGSAWIAASDLAAEGTWRWVAGPAAGQVFWQDGTTLTYADWALGEPNDVGLGEDYGEMYAASGTWNDIQGPLVQDRRPYVVEYFVPEPGTTLLLGIGVAGLVALDRRRRTQTSVARSRTPHGSASCSATRGES